MLRLEHLSKRYGDLVLFDRLTHQFAPGCVALCEEESTGKSTLLAIIAGLTAPYSGDVIVDGHSMTKTPAVAQGRVAYVPADCSTRAMQTGREMLERAALEKNAVIDDAVWVWISELGLEPHLDKRFEQMSTGTRRKVFLAAAALGDPAVIVADGPSDGLDSRARSVLAAQFKAWSANRLVLFASHDAELVRACSATPFNIEQHRASIQN